MNYFALANDDHWYNDPMLELLLRAVAVEAAYIQIVNRR